MHATTLRCAAGDQAVTAAVPATDVRARRAIELGLNVLASASEVSPSALDGQPDTYRLDASGLRQVETLLSALGGALDVGPLDGDAYDQLATLAKRLWEAERRPAVVLEQPELAVATTLFGRLRDELWELPLRWLVVVSPEVGATLDRPPSNAFFEVTIG